MSKIDRFRTPRGRIVAGHGALIATQFTFGLFPIFGAVVFQPGGLSPLGVGSWRLGAGAMALGVFAALRHGRRAIPQRRDLLRFFVSALLGVAINQGLFLVGLSRSTPMNAGIIMSLIPVFTFAIAALVGQEQFSPLRALGIAVALAGMVPMIFSGGIGVLGEYGIGNLFMVTNALAYSCFLVVSKPLTQRYPALVVTAWAYVLSCVCLPYFALGEQLVPDREFTLAWWALAYIVVFPTIIGYLLNMFALARVRASTTAVYVYSQPIITAIAAWVVFREEPTPAMLVAAATLFLGIWLVARQPPMPAEGPASWQQHGAGKD